MDATADLKQDHIDIRRLKNIAQRCSDKLYANNDVPIEDIKIISVIIEEFVDHFHHTKEEKAYFPETVNKNNFSEDIRRFLIEHELGRRIARMLLRELKTMTDESHSKEPTARFLKSYAVFITEHTSKEDEFFDRVSESKFFSIEENELLAKHYEICKNQMGGKERVEEMIKLIEYLEGRDWMK